MMSTASGSEPSPKHTNRLVHEKSPYLLQHAHNPVDWYPWGEEAFAKAKRENKPVILSIGYSTCHWCHVMEEESFENPKMAELMNEHFVSIKVDREERPDLDTIYMSYVMATTGGGGWPMTVFLTPDKKPFFGGTYFPPDDKFGITGFKSLLLSISDAWKNRHEELLNSAESAVSYLKSQQLGGGSLDLTEEALKDCFKNYSQRFDSEWGGFGSAPKFPMSHSLSFLLRYWHRSDDPQALQMAEKTLKSMAEGGMHDQVGGGFHRYSTDRQWFLPHFEKMLYDQALIARAYLEAAQATRDKKYADTARGILDYVLEEMTSVEGGFFSAQDADSLDPSDLSKKKEGAFYVWKKSQVEALLGKKQADIFSFYFGVREEGNVEQDPHHEFVGQNVLFQAHSLEETAAQFKISAPQVEEEIVRAKGVLKKARSGRPPLHLDDKILTDWNGLMISSFAFASRSLNEPRYAKAATRAAEFISQTLKDKDGRLLHRYRDGEAAIMANLDDYAFTVYAHLELYQATFDERWLKEARELANQMISFFWDEDKKGFFLTAKDAEVLITRPKQDYDGALPSGNSMAALDLLWLNRMTGEERFENYAQETFKAFSELIASQPSGFTQMLIALDFALGPSYEIVIASDGAQSKLEEFTAEINTPFLPNKVVLLHRPGKEGQSLEKLAPFLRDQLPVNGKTAVYVCRNHACQFPVTEPAELVSILSKK